MKTMKGSELQPVVVVHVKEGMQVLPFRRGGFYLDVFGVEHLAVAMTSAAGGGGSAAAACSAMCTSRMTRICYSPPSLFVDPLSSS